jgi:hypothetical protein
LQVSPVEIEDTLLVHPDKLIIDVSVAGVSGGRTLDERIPRAWVVLSPEGHKLGASATMAKLDAWVRESLSKYKWLRGGIEVVDMVRCQFHFKGVHVFMQRPSDSKITHGKGIKETTGREIRERAEGN